MTYRAILGRRLHRFIFVHQDGIAIGMLCITCLILGFTLGALATIEVVPPEIGR